MIAINYFAIAAATLAAMVIGSLWYSPVLFGKVWMKARGISPKNMKGMSMPMREMIIEALSSFITAYVLAILTLAFGAHSFRAIFLLALLVWIGFYVTAQLSEVLWEDRPFTLLVVNASQRLVTLLTVGLIVGLWQ
jgi:hypothetical protein